MLTRPDPITYLDHAANAGRAYEQRLLDALDLRPDHTALDIGCGPGTDLPAMAEQEDRARIDPVLHLVTDPTTALTELRRVLRPAGRAAPARPDWETLAVDPGPVAFTLFRVTVSAA